MRWLVLVLLVLAAGMAACTKEESPPKQEVAAKADPVAVVPVAKRAPASTAGSASGCDENASVDVDLNGDWVYGRVAGKGPGAAKVQQRGSCFQMSATWTTRGDGPHYSMDGRIQGQTVDSSWRGLSGGGTGTVSFEIDRSGNKMTAVRASGGGFEGLHWTRP